MLLNICVMVLGKKIGEIFARRFHSLCKFLTGSFCRKSPIYAGSNYD